MVMQNERSSGESMAKHFRSKSGRHKTNFVWI